MSEMITNNGIYLIALIVILTGSIYFWLKTDKGKRFFHLFILKIPFVGELIKEVNSARTARSMASLISSGVDVLESLRITKDIVQNIHYKEVIQSTADKIEKGGPISEVFRDNDKLYPNFFAEMMEVGEETGKIGEMLMGVAVYYEDDVEQKTKDISTVIEPILMVIIACGVGFFAIAMISPMYSLANTM